jgi:tetratricopeptide (TPR) repeat protein
MGKVFLAKDFTLDRLVALKVIDPTLRNQSEMEQRFLTEVRTAQEVAHPNVVSVYELHADHTPPFITMAYIEGRDLHSALSQSELSLDARVEIIKQICRGLAAIHRKGITHRDLKPGNIMIRQNGEALIADFGLAKSQFSPEITATGYQPGTFDYMSPEQMRGQPLDSRSDIYALGLIMFRILTGRLPDRSRGGSQVSEFNQAVPKPLAKIVSKCLQEKIDDRYQNVDEILADLDRMEDGRSWLTSRWLTLALPTLLIMGAIGWLTLRTPRNATAAVHKKVTVLIADFENATGQPVLDSTLEPVTTLALEGAPFINSFDRNRARRLASSLRPNAEKLDGPLANLIATQQGIDVVVDGTINVTGNQYNLTVRAVDPRNGAMLDSEQGSVGDALSLLSLVPKLIAPIRRKLGDTTPESAELAKQETFTASSIEAAHSYAIAQQLQMRGEYKNAIDAYRQTIQLDPQMGRAYAGAATMFLNLDDRQEADNYFHSAMKLSSRMTDREKHRTWGNYFITDGSLDKAIEEYRALVAQYPFDNAGEANLAFAYFLKHDFQHALSEGARALEIDPEAINHRNNYAIYAMYAGDFSTAQREARVVQVRNPRFTKAYSVLALTQMLTGAVNEARDTYNKLLAMNTPDADYYARSGLADIAFYEGRLKDAAEIEREMMTAETNALRKSKEQARLAMIYAAAQDRQQAFAVGKTSNPAHAAAPAADFENAMSLLHAGYVQPAASVAGRLGSSLQPEQQLLGKLLAAELKRNQSSYTDALQLTHEALKIADSWLGHFETGLIYLSAKMYPEAESEFETCLNRRGEAAAVFLDDVPSVAYLPSAYYYIGRAKEGRADPSAAEDYRKFLAIKKSREDPLVVDCDRRLRALQEPAGAATAQNQE